MSYVEVRLWFSLIVELWFWCLQGPSLSLGYCFVIPGCLYFIHGLVSRVSHGLGLGLGLSHTVELWFWCLQGPSLSLGGC